MAAPFSLCPLAHAGLRQVAPGEGAVVQVQQWGPLLLYSTQRGGLHAWDLRMDRDAWQLPAAPSQASQVGGVAGLFQEGLPASCQWAAGDWLLREGLLCHPGIQGCSHLGELCRGRNVGFTMSRGRVFTSAYKQRLSSCLPTSSVPSLPSHACRAFACGALNACVSLTPWKLTDLDLSAGRGAAHVHGAIWGLLGPHREFQGPDGAVGHEVSAPGGPWSGQAKCIHLLPLEPAAAREGKREGTC